MWIREFFPLCLCVLMVGRFPHRQNTMIASSIDHSKKIWQAGCTEVSRLTSGQPGCPYMDQNWAGPCWNVQISIHSFMPLYKIELPGCCLPNSPIYLSALKFKLFCIQYVSSSHNFLLHMQGFLSVLHALQCYIMVVLYYFFPQCKSLSRLSHAKTVCSLCGWCLIPTSFLRVERDIVVPNLPCFKWLTSHSLHLQ